MRTYDWNDPILTLEKIQLKIVELFKKTYKSEYTTAAALWDVENYRTLTVSGRWFYAFLGKASKPRTDGRHVFQAVVLLSPDRKSIEKVSLVQDWKAELEHLETLEAIFSE